MIMVPIASHDLLHSQAPGHAYKVAAEAVAHLISMCNIRLLELLLARAHLKLLFIVLPTWRVFFFY